MRRFDVAGIKARHDLRVVAEQLLGPAPHGRDYSDYKFWCCPFHDDTTPSLAVHRLYYKCHACGVGGDVITFVQHYLFDRHPDSFVEACRWLGGELTLTESAQPASRFVQESPFKHRDPPSVEFQAVLEEVVQAGQKELAQPKSPGAAYLVSQRGIQIDTALGLGLGYLDLRTPVGRAVQRKAALSHLWLSFWRGKTPYWRGILLPFRGLGDLYGVRVRRFVEEKDLPKADRYTQITAQKQWKTEMFAPALGSGLFMADFVQPGLPGLLVEGELNAVTVWQEAHDLINVFSIGAAPELLDARWFLVLARCTRLYGMYDADPAGHVGSDHMQALLKGIRMVQVEGYKDLNALHIMNGDIHHGAVRQWVERLLETDAS